MKWTDYLDDPGLREFTPRERAGMRALVRRGYEEWAEGLEGVGRDGEGQRTVGGGRAAHPMVALPDGGWAVVRRFYRGGAMRHLNRDRYFLGHRAFDELRATERARGAGVRVPDVLAAVEWGRGFGYGALLATRWIADSVGMDRWLAERDSAPRREALRQAGEQIARMHGAGIAHPDLNLRNLLVSGDSTSPTLLVHLIDFDRARVGDRPVSTTRRTRDLQRLDRSARKLGVPFGPGGWDALREGYGAEWPLDSAFG